MTIDQMNEIAEWLSPLDDRNNLDYEGPRVLGNTAQYPIWCGSGKLVFLYFKEVATVIHVQDVSEEWICLAATSVWEQICLRCL